MSSLQAASARLGALLQLAFSGERAAAYAYRGHWKSLAAGADRERVRAIEDDEWRHREEVGRMLAALGVKPGAWREGRALLVGRTLGLLCHVSGWLAPMFGAGLLESHNMREYEAAARLALRAGRPAWVDCLLTMAEVEWDHEQFFRSCVLRHRLGRRLPIWSGLPPREHIRASFAQECMASSGVSAIHPEPTAVRAG